MEIKRTLFSILIPKKSIKLTKMIKEPYFKKSKEI